MSRRKRRKSRNNAKIIFISKKKNDKQPEESPAERELRNSKLKCWKRWMIHENPGQFDGWLIYFSNQTAAAGW